VFSRSAAQKSKSPKREPHVPSNKSTSENGFRPLRARFFVFPTTAGRSWTWSFFASDGVVSRARASALTSSKPSPWTLIDLELLAWARVPAKRARAPLQRELRRRAGRTQRAHHRGAPLRDLDG